MKPLSIEAAKRFAKATGADGVIVLAFDENQFASTSYGTDRFRCGVMKRLAEVLLAPIEDGRIDPWEPEPLDDGL